MAALPCESATFDAQLVGFDKSGRTVEWCRRTGFVAVPAAIRLYVFDLLELNGRYLQGLPLALRRANLERLFASAGEAVCLTEMWQGDPEPALRFAREAGQPGVVAKRVDSPYEEGFRSGDWVKWDLPAQRVQAGRKRLVRKRSWKKEITSKKTAVPMAA
jgi:bifunctional non-homologous end joining protein LigD